MPEATPQAILDLIRELVAELQQGRSITVKPDSRLERDLGIDSLARVELLLRLQQRLGLSLPDEAVFEADTVADLLDRLQQDQSLPVTEAQPAAARETAPVAWPEGARSLVEVLQFHAERYPERNHLSFYARDDQVETLTYGQLYEAARRVAASLRARAVEPGDRVALMLPSGLDFFYAFYGTLCAGAVPVPLYPPTSKAHIEGFLQRQAGILRNAGTPVFITNSEIQPFAKVLQTQVASLAHIVTPDELRTGPAEHCVPRGPDDLAFLQYTSGSTGQPKGVMLTHGNLLANVRAMGRATRVSGDDVFVSWLPLYHDMGLIGACLGSLYHGLPLVLMSPLSFVARPQRWLHAIHRHRGTLSAAPNFAYQLCASRLADKDLDGLDLSCWRLAFNGAEPVHADTLDAFCERLAPHGFRRSAMTPVYGLAENAVGLGFPPPGRGPRIDTINRDTFAREGLAEPVLPEDPAAMPVVGGGMAIPDHAIRIVDEAGRPLPERRQGRLQFRGPSAAAGYFNNPEATAALCDGDWRNTGDYAYLADGEIFITGRAKDLIIRAGRNLYPYELEQAVGSLAGIRKDAVAVFAAQRPGQAGEQLVVLAESREREAAAREALKEQIRQLAMDILDTPPDDILLAPPRSVLKTSSGKIRRVECRQLYERGALVDGTQAPDTARWKRVQIALTAVRTRSKRFIQTGSERLYAGWVWALFGTLATLSLGLILLSPSRRLSQWMAHVGARLFFLLAGIAIEVHHPERFPTRRRVVIAANHASYLDAIVLHAAFNHPLHFVAKKELGNFAPFRWTAHKLGDEFVDRADVKQSVAVTERILERVHTGDGIAFFPEGTFTEASGLRPFRLGAFQIAVDTNTPVLPVALVGTRAILRGETWFPRPGRIEIHTAELLEPAGRDWAAVVALRDQTRASILRHCGEPDLQEHTSLEIPSLQLPR